MTEKPEVAHVVLSIDGTVIPLEIATMINEKTSVDVSIISLNEFTEIPDTVNENLIINELTNPDSISELLNQLVAQDYDIVHSHHNRPAAKIGIRSKKKDITHVNTQHGHIHYSKPQKALNLITLATSDALLYNSKATMNSYNFVENMIKYRAVDALGYNGVHIDRISGYETTINSVNTGITASRLIDRKNIDTLIRSLEYTDLHLKIIGDGPQRERLKIIVDETEVTQQVTFLGYIQDRSNVYAEMAECDVFLFPSESEGFGVALAEAMAIGLPPIISDIPVFHELVGQNGIYIDDSSPKEIGQAIIQLQENPIQARKLGKKAQKQIFENFTLTDTARQYEMLYEDLSSVPYN